MNLPKINERESIVQKAHFMFGFKVLEILNKKNVKYDAAFSAISECIINLSKEQKVICSEIPNEIEVELMEVTNELELTYGEQVYILTNLLQWLSSDLIKFERETKMNDN
ncbi:hypothetical protein [Bacillus toyonensis]|uniref:hypothetical protein n=1 Tax=Bacillus toyonensis TaxID=155322 RepID=UPI002E209FA0|nr:hypothetical protein [Bacillus toyonensis]